MARSISTIGWDKNNSPILVMDSQQYIEMYKKTFPDSPLPEGLGEKKYIIVDGSHRWHCLWEKEMFPGDPAVDGVECIILNSEGKDCFFFW